QQRSRRFDRGLLVELRRRIAGGDDPERVAHLCRGRQLHRAADGHGQSRSRELDVTHGRRDTPEPAARRVVHAELQWADLQLHEYEQRPGWDHRLLQLELRRWDASLDAPESVAHLRRGRQLHGDAAGDGQSGRAECPGLTDLHGDAAEPTASRVIHEVVQWADVQLHEYQQRSRRLDRLLQLELRRWNADLDA